MIQITVQDDGIGIAEDELHSIFEPFSKSTSLLSQKHNLKGNGVGLSISKAICRSLEGDIEVNSQLGEGATFTFTMKVLIP